MASAPNPLPGVPCVESPFFHELLAAAAPSAETRRIATDLNRDGFAVFDFPDPAFDRRAAAIRAALDSHYDWPAWRAGGHARGEGLRVQDAWRFDEDVRGLAVNEAVLALLRTLYGREPRPFQTLNFPVGTQQHFHSDSAHFSSVPERFMCGVWVALEDIEADAGPLVYYPGSHAWPVYTNEMLEASTAGRQQLARVPVLWDELVRVHGVAPRRFLARRGQALIWAANLLHGGDRHVDPGKTRWSQVTHYYFDGCAYYTPLFSDPFQGSVLWRTPSDIRTGAPLPNVLAGEPIDPAYIEAAGARARRAQAGEAAPPGEPERDVVLDETRARLAETSAEAQALRARIAAMERSRSWRITAPLRRIASWGSPAAAPSS